MKDDINPDFWSASGLPVEIAEYIANFCRNAVIKQHPLIDRARRFRSYWEGNPDADTVSKNWKKLKENVVNQEDALVGVFLVWPDQPKRQPYDALYGGRKIGMLELTVDQERAAYKSLGDDAERLAKFLKGGQVPSFQHLLEDAGATGGDAAKKAAMFQNLTTNPVITLMLLADVLRSADPGAKYPSRQPDGSNAPMSSYVVQLAELNRKFIKDQSTAIANLANVNNPDAPVKADAIRKAWARLKDKND
ncbi:hypothetical protein [Herbaspirillum chlorophenolicum]|uniref:hypothetical protein n=1 Tax=Herbaspirillum chlorophenolicum TaxID=211589 RepID=UPI00067DBC54|nr:hypothetical protein [Herbaspirillum chlorophenolicum]